MLNLLRFDHLIEDGDELPIAGGLQAIHVPAIVQGNSHSGGADRPDSFLQPLRAVQ